MKRAVFTDDNGSLKLIYPGSYLPFEDGYELSDETDGVLVGHISSYENAEKIKKYIIEKKINGAFILVDIDLGEKGSLYPSVDNEMIKKMKELCLFADAVFLNYTEACFFTNLTCIDGLEEKDAQKLIFKLNSFGMANKLIITSVPFKDKGCKTVVSEYGEFEILDDDCVSGDKNLPAVLVFKEMLSGKKVLDAVSEAVKSL